jgi:hypothetical protein
MADLKKVLQHSDARKILHQGHQLHSVGIGNCQNSELLKDIANLSKGCYSYQEESWPLSRMEEEVVLALHRAINKSYVDCSFDFQCQDQFSEEVRENDNTV